jgi:hypothetical protein
MRKRLEQSLALVVIVLAVWSVQVQGHGGIRRESPEKLRDQLGLQIADALGAKIRVEYRIRSTSDVQRAHGQRLVHRQRETAVSRDVDLVADSRRESATHRYARILDCMMPVHLQIALADDPNIEPAVHGKSRQHMIEKPYARIDICPAIAIEI